MDPGKLEGSIELKASPSSRDDDPINPEDGNRYGQPVEMYAVQHVNGTFTIPYRRRKPIEAGDYLNRLEITYLKNRGITVKGGPPEGGLTQHAAASK